MSGRALGDHVGEVIFVGSLGAKTGDEHDRPLVGPKGVAGRVDQVEADPQVQSKRPLPMAILDVVERDLLEVGRGRDQDIKAS